MHPRHHVLPCPGQVGRAALAGAQLDLLAQRQRVQGVVGGEGLEHLDRDRLVADRVQVQPVLVHDLADLPAAHPPHVHQRGVVAVGDLADPLVEDRHPPAQWLEHRVHAGVGDREHHDPGTGGGEPADALVVRRGERVEVHPRAQHVVAAAVDRDQVRGESDRRLDLLGEDRGQLAPAHREVGVAEVGGRRRQHLGHPVGPATQAVGPGRVGVTDPLGEGVSERDVTVVGLGRHGHILS